jgi:hypothetical protein
LAVHIGQQQLGNAGLGLLEEAGTGSFVNNSECKSDLLRLRDQEEEVQGKELKCWGRREIQAERDVNGCER